MSRYTNLQIFLMIVDLLLLAAVEFRRNTTFVKDLFLTVNGAVLGTALCKFICFWSVK